MKNFISSLILSVVLLPVLAQNTPITIYYSTVKMPASMWPEYYRSMDTKIVAEDMAQLLSEACNTTIKTAAYQNQSGNGIYLLLDDALKLTGNESSIINSDGKTQLTIKARFVTGLSYGVYTYLDQLGFRFYLPGKQWNYIPAIKSPITTPFKNTVFKPSFKLRMFTPSGAMPRVKGLDENGRLQKEWHEWYRRNRMGADYLTLGGHIGEMFNAAHQADIEKDPKILAPIKEKRGYDMGGKIDPTYPKGIQLFGDYITKQYQQNNQQLPEFFPRANLQTVDPADGYDYCRTPECLRQFKSISDQVFYIANATGDRIKKDYPNAGVSLYAYAEKADTPSIKLKPNVHVCIIPTGFQNIDIPAGVIQRWQKKTTNLSMYDYLNIGVWSTDQPFYDLNEYFNFLKLINKAKLDGVSYETSAAGFGSGLLQFFVLRFLCKPYANADAEFDQFCNHSFGAAAKDIKIILREWYFSDKYIQTMYDRPTFSEDDLGRMINTYNNAAKAKGLTNNQSANLFAVKAYLVFLCKYYEFWGDIVNRGKMIKNNQLKVNHLDDMLQFTWKLYELKILHNTQLNDVIKTYIPENKAFADKWDYYQSNQFAQITNGMNETVDREFNIMMNRYSKLATPNYTLPAGFFENAAKLTADSILIETTDEIGYNSMRYSLNVFCSAPGKMSIRYAAGDSKTKDVHEGSVGFIAINNGDYSFMQRQFILPEKRNGNFVIHFPKKGLYVLTLSQRLATHIDFVIKPGKQLLYVHKNVLPAQGIVLNDKAEKPKYDNQYIAAWVPNVDSVYYNIVYPETYNMNHVVNHKGQKLPLNTTIGPHHISCAIQPSDKNNFLYFHNTLFRWGFVLKNVPSYFFFLRKPTK